MRIASEGETQITTPTVEPRIKIPQLPTRELGFKNVPAVPIDGPGMLDTLVRLGIRFKQREQALQGLSKTYTIGGTMAPARDFLLGKQGSEPNDGAPLEHLHQLLSRNRLGLLPTIVEAIVSQGKNTLPSAGPLTESGTATAACEALST